MIDNRAVGKTIATLRQNRNMTQQQLAATLNVSHQAVSKWENGAALPDVQTLMDLTRLFGITVEQLLNGEVAPEKLENRPAEDPLQNIGNFFNNIVTGIFQPAKKPAEGDIPENDGAQDAETDAAPVNEATEAPQEDAEAEEEEIDLKRLLQMAPFMSKQAVDELLIKHREKLTSADIAQFAPYISRECLEKLIQNPETEITWETLQRIAPFLHREVVDSLAKVAARGSKFARDVANGNKKCPDDLGKTLEDVSRTLGKGVDRAIRKAAKLGENVANEVTNAWNSIVDGAKAGTERTNALRRAAQERALQDDKWEWLTAHIDEVTDEDLRRAIARKANDLGMGDWVLEHLTDYAAPGIVDDAIESGNWDWLGDHVWQFDNDVQEKVALAAVQAENWQWLSDYAEQISMDNCADRVAIAAWRAGVQPLAMQLVERGMTREQREALANEVVSNGDYAFLAQLEGQLSPGYFGRLCVARAQDGDWETVERFIGMIDSDSAAQLMELAIAEGNFDAVDLVDPHL